MLKTFKKIFILMIFAAAGFGWYRYGPYIIDNYLVKKDVVVQREVKEPVKKVKTKEEPAVKKPESIKEKRKGAGSDTYGEPDVTLPVKVKLSQMESIVAK